jgi:hypothetical protein
MYETKNETNRRPVTCGERQVQTTLPGPERRRWTVHRGSVVRWSGLRPEMAWTGKVYGCRPAQHRCIELLAAACVVGRLPCGLDGQCWGCSRVARSALYCGHRDEHEILAPGAADHLNCDR